MGTSTKIKLFAVIAVIAGPFLTYNGHQDKERLARLEKEGVTVDGIIEGRSGKKESIATTSLMFPTPRKTALL